MAIDWEHWDTVIHANGVVIDRAKGSPHPRFPAAIYPFDYGYIPGTAGGDGEPVDVFVGAAIATGLVGCIATRDALKGDDEIKLLWNVNDAEMATALAFLNQGGMTGHLIVRPHETAALMAPSVRRKAYAYITHRRKLLLFRHPFSPQAGIQVPGGTVGSDEDPATAVLREAYEETGLTNLRQVAFLGVAVRTMDDFPHDFAPGEVHHRYFFHLQSGGDPSLTWRHHELFGPHAEAEPIAFDFFWVDLRDDLPELIADQGQFVPQLRENLRRQPS